MIDTNVSHLTFDSETSGLWKDTLSWDDPAQPHLLQLGAKLYDARGRQMGSMEAMIIPQGWSIEPGAEKVHGITEQRASRYGVPLFVSLAMFHQLAMQAELVVAHNFEFDWRVIAAALKRAGSNAGWWVKKRVQSYCTMEHATDHCRLPGQYGEHKWPSLTEAHAILLPTVPFSESHAAGEDVDAAERLFREIIRRETALKVGTAIAM